MRYFRTARFRRAFRALDPQRQARVEHAMRQLETMFEKRELSHGLGLKPLQRGCWEIRAGLSERIVFRRSADLVEFLLVGDHEEIRRFLKSL